jgi:hypothetical protein
MRQANSWRSCGPRTGPSSLNNIRDYRPLHHEAIVPGGPGHSGVIFMPGGYRRTKADPARIIAAIEAMLAKHPGERDLEYGEAWL